MKETTRYYRNALKAASQEVVDFREKDYSEVVEKELIAGKFSIERINKDLKLEWDPQNDEEKKQIMIAAKTICLNYDYSEKTKRNVDQLASLLFIPAIINKEGELLPPEDNQLPWIPTTHGNYMKVTGELADTAANLMNLIYVSRLDRIGMSREMIKEKMCVGIVY